MKSAPESKTSRRAIASVCGALREIRRPVFPTTSLVAAVTIASASPAKSNQPGKQIGDPARSP
jgi:hypothetical protein